MTTFPIRCVTCGKVLAHLYPEFQSRTDSGEDGYEVLNALSISRFCCRRMFLTHDTTMDRISLKYPAMPDRIQRVGLRDDEGWGDADAARRP